MALPSAQGVSGTLRTPGPGSLSAVMGLGGWESQLYAAWGLQGHLGPWPALAHAGHSCEACSLLFPLLEKPEVDAVHLGHQLSEARPGGEGGWTKDLYPVLK